MSNNLAQTVGILLLKKGINLTKNIFLLNCIAKKLCAWKSDTLKLAASNSQTVQVLTR